MALTVLDAALIGGGAALIVRGTRKKEKDWFDIAAGVVLAGSGLAQATGHKESMVSVGQPTILANTFAIPVKVPGLGPLPPVHVEATMPGPLMDLIMETFDACQADDTRGNRWRMNNLLDQLINWPIARRSIRKVIYVSGLTSVAV
jgi:hypothetical protein